MTSDTFQHDGAPWMNQRLAAAPQGAPLLNAWCAIPNTVSAEVLALQGWDVATVDLQHGLVDYQAALAMFQAIRSGGVPPMARVPWLEPGISMKLLDAGAEGLICPVISNADEARTFVSYCTYPQQGMRSLGPTMAAVLRPGYVEGANSGILKAVMIETAEALANVEDIAAVPGVDMLYVGPSDLAMSLGEPPALDATSPRVLSALKEIAAVARRHDKKAGSHCASSERARELARWGYSLVTIQSDLRLLAAGGTRTVNAAREAIAGGAD